MGSEMCIRDRPSGLWIHVWGCCRSEHEQSPGVPESGSQEPHDKRIGTSGYILSGDVAVRAANCSTTGSLALRERGDSAWGRLRHEGPQRVPLAPSGNEKESLEVQAWSHRRFSSSCVTCYTVEASAQTTHCTSTLSDYDNDAQLFELRRVAHRAEAVCAEARTAQTKANQAAREAEDRRRESQRKLQAQVYC